VPECTCLRCGLSKKHEARGLCEPCYLWARRHRQLDRYPKSVRTPAEWIAMIDRSDPLTCWPWPGPISDKGYGNASGPAHRLVYQLMVGPIPEGQQIDHSCHNDAECAGGKSCQHRLCVNWVNHLRTVTARVNLLASPNTVNSINVMKDHCPRDHPYDEANTSYRNGRRHCRACDRDRSRRYYHGNLELVRAKARDYQRERRAQDHAPVTAAGDRQL
jgi:hypothetical protein